MTPTIEEEMSVTTQRAHAVLEDMKRLETERKDIIDLLRMQIAAAQDALTKLGADAVAPRKRRGRPAGSRNKKQEVVNA